MISRQLFDSPPIDLLQNSNLEPASNINKLSPADRVFGWVGDKVKVNGNYKGQIRFGNVECKTQDSLHLFGNENDFNTWLPLNNLGQPKPQQGRFYVAESENGEAQKFQRDSKESGYERGRGLRGRKVYPHHSKLPDGYWFEGKEVDFSQIDNLKTGNRYREYYRPPGKPQRDGQNRSMQGWVKPDTEFEFDLHFINLSEVELGALIWLLSLPEDHFHRLGGGKPLGFGSIRLSIKDSEIFDGDEIKKRYETLDDVKLTKKNLNEYKTTFENILNSVYKDANLLEIFKRASKGFEDGKPIRYPRTTEKPYETNNRGQEQSESFRWFVANNGKKGMKLSLPDLLEDDGFPRIPEKSRKRR